MLEGTYLSGTQLGYKVSTASIGAPAASMTTRSLCSQAGVGSGLRGRRCTGGKRTVSL